MASVPTFSPNPYGNFDPTQWSNPYSPFQSSALPWPPTYGGTPTNALGQPIASYQQWQQQNQPPPQAPPTPGMTLNSSAASPGNNGQMTQLLNTLIQNAQGAPQHSWGNNQMGTGQGNLIGNLSAQRAALQAQPQTAAPPPAPAAPNNWQAALAARANPGFVATPGATVPQSPTNYQPGPGVLQQFLQNWRPGSSGPGAGFQQAFANALQQGR
jgi:hypothetical protein